MIGINIFRGDVVVIEQKFLTNFIDPIINTEIANLGRVGIHGFDGKSTVGFVDEFVGLLVLAGLGGEEEKDY